MGVEKEVFLPKNFQKKVMNISKEYFISITQEVEKIIIKTVSKPQHNSAA